MADKKKDTFFDFDKSAVLHIIEPTEPTEPRYFFDIIKPQQCL
jgi:hypothetical protein